MDKSWLTVSHEPVVTVLEKCVSAVTVLSQSTVCFSSHSLYEHGEFLMISHLLYLFLFPTCAQHTQLFPYHSTFSCTFPDCCSLFELKRMNERRNILCVQLVKKLFLAALKDESQ